MPRNAGYYMLGLFIGFVILVVSQQPPATARMIACDVGQGDAILIIKGSNQTLIDGGPSGEKILACLEKYVPFWDRTIELIVLTNTDYDHMNGLSAVVERYSLTKIVTGDGAHESAAFERFYHDLTARSIRVLGVEQGEKITVGTRDALTFHVLWPPHIDRRYVAVFGNELNDSERSQILGASANRGNLNERSVVLLLDENGYKVLLTGDSGNQTEKSLMEQGLLPDVDVLKVGHHGSKYSTSAEFLEKIRPETAVISVGAKNSYGHPTAETLDRLSKIGAIIRRTDTEGDIVVALH